MLPEIGAFMESSLIEWPGKIATAVALQGCNFRCPFCHSAPLVPAKGDEIIPFDAVLRHFEKLRGWIDGTVVSGGEPTIHDGLIELLREIRSAGLAIKLDTNGSLPDRLAEVLETGLVDYVAMDVKAPLDEEKYSRSAGVRIEVDDIRRSIGLLLSSTVECEFRTTLCPAVLTEDDLLTMASELTGAKRWYLQQFRPMGCLDPAMLEVEPWAPERLRSIAQRCAAIAQGCLVRGIDWATREAAAETGP